MSISSISPIPQKKEIIWATKTLHVFNPEHDLVLAVGKGSYTPPAEVVKLRKEKSLLPAIYASDGDFILLPDELKINEVENLDNYELAKRKRLVLLFKDGLKDIRHEISNVMPWGWDYVVKNILEENGIPSEILPSEQEITTIRDLSHRRTTIPFRETISNRLNENLINPGEELKAVSEVEKFLLKYPLAYFKAPWSSSGRGIVVSDHIKRKGLLEWAHGVIRKQGSLIAEPAWKRVFDFATEWQIEKGMPYFKGYSVFHTSSRGKYHGNVSCSQDKILEMIYDKAPGFDERILEAQRYAISKFISPAYNGPLGIDMLSDSEGNINSCVEINLRLTMGFIEIIKN